MDRQIPEAGSQIIVITEKQGAEVGTLLSFAPRSSVCLVDRITFRTSAGSTVKREQWSPMTVLKCPASHFTVLDSAVSELQTNQKELLRLRKIVDAQKKKVREMVSAAKREEV